MISTVREHSDNKTLIAGTGLESIKETIDLTNEAAKNGADYALIITPSFYKTAMNHKALLNYYTAVADSISIPLIIYSVTKFTNVNIEIETIAKLAEHPNIIGIKNSSENIAEINATIYNTPNDFNVLVGTGSVLLYGLISGAVGGILALANIAPDVLLSNAPASWYVSTQLSSGPNVALPLIPTAAKPVSDVTPVPLSVCKDHLLFNGELNAVPWFIGPRGPEVVTLLHP